MVSPVITPIEFCSKEMMRGQHCGMAGKATDCNVEWVLLCVPAVLPPIQISANSLGKAEEDGHGASATLPPLRETQMKLQSLDLDLTQPQLLRPSGERTTGSNAFLFLSVFPSLCVTPSYKSLENERKFKTFLKNQNAQVPTHVKWFMFSFNCIWLSSSSPFLWPWRSKHLPHAWGCSGCVYLAALSPWVFS